MKTDRERLELAAKAAGVPVIWDEEVGCYLRTDRLGTVPWNPLTGDALRLACVLEDPRNTVFFEQRCEAATELRRLIAEVERLTKNENLQMLRALKTACEKLLSHANWRVGGTLTPESKRSDYQSTGCSTVKTRDLASVRDAMKGTS